MEWMTCPFYSKTKVQFPRVYRGEILQWDDTGCGRQGDGVKCSMRREFAQCSGQTLEARGIGRCGSSYRARLPGRRLERDRRM